MSKRKIGGDILKWWGLLYKIVDFKIFMDFGGQDVDPGPAVGVQNSHGSGGHFCDFGGWFKSWDFGHVFLVLRPGV